MTGLPEITIREAAPDDIPAITAIYMREVLHNIATFEIEPPDDIEMLRRLNATRDSGFPYIVALVDGGIAGYAYAGTYRARRAYRFTVEDSVYVSPDFQRLGVATRLLAGLIEDCSQRGFRQMVAVISDENNIPSIRFHESVGFEKIGIMPAVGYKFEKWHGTMVMQRPLGDGDATSPAETG